MRHPLRKAILTSAPLLAIIPFPAAATTVEVNGLTDVPGTSYRKLSDAVNYVQSTGSGPHSINITTNTLSVADGQIFINTPMTIEGDADNDGNKADILVDLSGIQASATTNIGPANKAYIDVQTSGAVTIRNLKIHPNADSTATGTNNAVNGIQLFKPALAGEVASYTLDQVWVSGSDSSANHNYVPLDTGADLFDQAGVKRWTRNTTGTVQSSASDAWAPIVLSNGGNGTYTANLNNCHAGLSRSTALSILGTGTTVNVTGGLYGHSLRDGIHAEGAFVTIKGTPTNRVRVLRVPHEDGRDAHGVEMDGTTVTLMEYVDAQCQGTGNSFKFANAGSATLVQYLRGLGKFDNGANPTFYVAGGFNLPDVRNSTFVGSGRDFRPAQVAGGSAGDVNFTNVIFTSENLGTIAADNTDTANGIRNLTNCAIPTDGVTSESLRATNPVANNGGTFLPTEVGTINTSPAFLATRLAYDWSEAAVSISGANTAAGNPNVLRPSNAAYATAGTNGTALVGGAGPIQSAVNDWQAY